VLKPAALRRTSKSASILSSMSICEKKQKEEEMDRIRALCFYVFLLRFRSVKFISFTVELLNPRHDGWMPELPLGALKEVSK